MVQRSEAFSDYASVAELEADVAYAAQLVLRYGDYIAPIFDRLERELRSMRCSEPPQQRARAFLERIEKQKADVRDGR